MHCRFLLNVLWQQLKRFGGRAHTFLGVDSTDVDEAEFACRGACASGFTPHGRREIVNFQYRWLPTFQVAFKRLFVHVNTCDKRNPRKANPMDRAHKQTEDKAFQP